AYEIFFGKTVGGVPTDSPRGLDEAVGRIRTLLEWHWVEKALDSGLRPGTVLAFDGALMAGIKGTSVMLERIVKAAAEKDILLCGISKKSMLTHCSRPLLPAVQIIGEEAYPKKAWNLPLKVKGYADRVFGEVFVAKLHPHSRHVFRVDLALPDGSEPSEIFGKLAGFSNDPTYVGYPYPLARVHNDVAFSLSEVEELRHMLRLRALEKGMDPKEWHLMFQDFHEVLDRSR
ncbi:MAG: DNA double-strand break repair nuclease NurA, partial [Thermoplasmata archaeon]|nr:DNA double-strand break repair nuclease NurA [Thermoplasmata archaeon]